MLRYTFTVGKYYTEITHYLFSTFQTTRKTRSGTKQRQSAGAENLHRTFDPIKTTTASMNSKDQKAEPVSTEEERMKLIGMIILHKAIISILFNFHSLFNLETLLKELEDIYYCSICADRGASDLVLCPGCGKMAMCHNCLVRWCQAEPALSDPSSTETLSSNEEINSRSASPNRGNRYTLNHSDLVRNLENLAGNESPSSEDSYSSGHSHETEISVSNDEGSSGSTTPDTSGTGNFQGTSCPRCRLRALHFHPLNGSSRIARMLDQIDKLKK